MSASDGHAVLNPKLRSVTVGCRGGRGRRASDGQERLPELVHGHVGRVEDLVGDLPSGASRIRSSQDPSIAEPARAPSGCGRRVSLKRAHQRLVVRIEEIRAPGPSPGSRLQPPVDGGETFGGSGPSRISITTAATFGMPEPRFNAKARPAAPAAASAGCPPRSMPENPRGRGCPATCPTPDILVGATEASTGCRRCPERHGGAARAHRSSSPSSRSGRGRLRRRGDGPRARRADARRAAPARFSSSLRAATSTRMATLRPGATGMRTNGTGTPRQLVELIVQAEALVLARRGSQRSSCTTSSTRLRRPRRPPTPEHVADVDEPDAPDLHVDARRAPVHACRSAPTRTRRRISTASSATSRCPRTHEVERALALADAALADERARRTEHVQQDPCASAPGGEPVVEPRGHPRDRDLPVGVAVRSSGTSNRFARLTQLVDRRQAGRQGMAGMSCPSARAAAHRSTSVELARNGPRFRRTPRMRPGLRYLSKPARARPVFWIGELVTDRSRPPSARDDLERQIGGVDSGWTRAATDRRGSSHGPGGRSRLRLDQWNSPACPPGGR